MAVLVTRCAPQPTPTPAEEERAMIPADRLVSSLQVEQLGDTLRMQLQVTNTSDAPVALTFPSGQSFDFFALRDGEEIWRWSLDQMFTQAIRSETLAPGATLQYDAVWSPPPGISGEITIAGTLTALDKQIEQRTQVSLP